MRPRKALRQLGPGTAASARCGIVRFAELGGQGQGRATPRGPKGIISPYLLILVMVNG
jgi:hypothetical protein